MFKKVSKFAFTVIGLMVCSCLIAEPKYEIQDLGTLDAFSSHAMALNNAGEILGWYENEGCLAKQFFFREADGTLHDLPSNMSEKWVQWRFLKEDGTVYGLADHSYPQTSQWLADENNPQGLTGRNLPCAILFSYSKKDGPRERATVDLCCDNTQVLKINSSGQILIKPIRLSGYKINGTILCPLVWQGVYMQALRGVSGSSGEQSDNAYGADMNEYGDIVGNSWVTDKNGLRVQHATKWISEKNLRYNAITYNEKSIDLNQIVSSEKSTVATGINDLGEVVFEGGYFLNKEMNLIEFKGHTHMRINNKYVYDFDSLDQEVYTTGGDFVVSGSEINAQLEMEKDPTWSNIKLISINDHGQIIAEGCTVSGQTHALLLTPVKE